MDADNGIPTAQLRISAPVRHPDGIHLSVAGDIDMTTGDLFTRTLTGLLDEPGLDTVRLDVGRLYFIDSNGITAILKAYRAARRRGITLTVANAGGPIRETLEMLGIYEMLAATTDAPPETPGPSVTDASGP